MKIAIYGGSFDPIHNGHLNVIKASLEALSCQRLIVVPVGDPPHKSKDSLLDSKHRLKMAMLATKPFENVFVSNYEATKSEKCYTFETLEYFKTLYPDDELYFLMGSDKLSFFLKWRGAERIMELCELVGICRSEEEKESAKASCENIISSGGKARLLECEAVKASSTEIRNALKQGIMPKDLLPEAVQDYIDQKGLYR